MGGCAPKEVLPIRHPLQHRDPDHRNVLGLPGKGLADESHDASIPSRGDDPGVRRSRRVGEAACEGGDEVRIGIPVLCRACHHEQCPWRAQLLERVLLQDLERIRVLVDRDKLRRKILRRLRLAEVDGAALEDDFIVFLSCSGLPQIQPIERCHCGQPTHRLRRGGESQSRGFDEFERVDRNLPFLADQFERMAA